MKLIVLSYQQSTPDACVLSLDDLQPIELRLLCPRIRPLTLVDLGQFQEHFLFRCRLQILCC